MSATYGGGMQGSDVLHAVPGLPDGATVRDAAKAYAQGFAPEPGGRITIGWDLGPNPDHDPDGWDDDYENPREVFRQTADFLVVKAPAWVRRLTTDGGGR